MNVNVTEPDNYTAVIGENICVLREQALSCLWVNGCDVCNWFSNGLENKYCIPTYIYLYVQYIF